MSPSSKLKESPLMQSQAPMELREMAHLELNKRRLLQELAEIEKNRRRLLREIELKKISIPWLTTLSGDPNMAA